MVGKCMIGKRRMGNRIRIRKACIQERVKYGKEEFN